MPGTAGMFVTLCLGSDSLCQTDKSGYVVNLIFVDALPLLDTGGLSSEGKIVQIAFIYFINIAGAQYRGTVPGLDAA